MTTSIRLGGSWTYEIISGIMLRDVADLPTTTFEFVASSNIQISKYTDHHDVDEELRTFTRQGGQWPEGSLEGITYRYIFNSSSYAADDVASVKNKDWQPINGLLVSYTYFRLMNVSWIQQISCNQTIHL